MLATTTYFESELTTIDTQIAEYQQLIERLMASKQELEEKALLANHALTTLKDAVSTLSGKASEAFRSAVAELLNITPVAVTDDRTKPSELPERSQQTPKDNEYFQWHPVNQWIGCYFDNGKGKTHTTYIGGNYKGRLESWMAWLANHIPGLSMELRKAKRLNTKYEIKVWGLDDNDIGWLAGAYSELFSPVGALTCKLEEIAQHPGYLEAVEGVAYHLCCLLEDNPNPQPQPEPQPETADKLTLALSTPEPGQPHVLQFGISKYNGSTALLVIGKIGARYECLNCHGNRVSFPVEALNLLAPTQTQIPATFIKFKEQPPEELLSDAVWARLELLAAKEPEQLEIAKTRIKQHQQGLLKTLSSQWLLDKEIEHLKTVSQTEPKKAVA